MRIAIVAPEQIPVPPVLGGSVEITILAIAKKLAEHHSVTVISRTHPRYPRQSVVNGVHVCRVPSGSAKTYLANVLAFMAGRKYDIVQIDNRPLFVPPIKRMFPKAKVSLFLHSLTFVSKPYASRFSAGNGLKAADMIIANSSSLKQQLARLFPGSAAKIRKVWLGVDTDRFTPPKRNQKRKTFKVMFAGRLIPRKGLPVLLRAVRLVQNKHGKRISLWVAGGAHNKAYGARMRSLARRLGVHARFLGTVPHARIHLTYRQADMFVCPSQKHEAFGLVNVEAMSSGLPVIASAIGGIKEIVRHGENGMLINAYRKPKAFADAIIRLMSSPTLLAKMKLRARQDCLKNFSWTTTARRLSQLYSLSETAAAKNMRESDDDEIEG